MPVLVKILAMIAALILGLMTALTTMGRKY